MNERIKLLAEQSDATVLGTISGGRQYTFLEQDLAKFAELIVQECAGKVDWIYAEKGKTIDGVDFTVTQGDLIKQHFGVE